MENPRPEKVAVVDEVRSKMSSADAVLLTEYRGLDVAALAVLRRQLRERGGEYKIYKNTLVRRAARELVDDHLDEALVGPVAVAFVQGDAAAVAKVLRDFARTHPLLVLKGGLLGERPLTAGDVEILADLPSREVVLSQLAGLLQAPLQQFATLLDAAPRQLAYALQALIDKQGGEPSPADAPTTDEQGD